MRAYTETHPSRALRADIQSAKGHARAMPGDVLTGNQTQAERNGETQG